MEQYIVCYMRFSDSADLDNADFLVFDDYDEALREYNELIELAYYSVSLCVPIKSTDYVCQEVTL